MLLWFRFYLIEERYFHNCILYISSNCFLCRYMFKYLHAHIPVHDCTLPYHYLDKQHSKGLFTVPMHVGYHNECHSLNCFVHRYAHTPSHPRREHNTNIHLNLPALKKEDYRLYRRASSWYLYHVLQWFMVWWNKNEM